MIFIKYSRQREMIRDVVKHSHSHHTADEVYTILKPEMPNLSLGTVYRNLNLLADQGEILKIPVPNGSDRFDGTLHAHHHVLCTHCGRVCDVDLPQLAQIDAYVAQITGYEIDGCNFVFRGLCPACSKQTDLKQAT